MIRGLYKSGAYFQFKAKLFHVGLTTEHRTDDGAEAIDDTWQLEQPVGHL